MIIGIAGPTACGKTTVAKMLETEHNAYRTRYSEILATHSKALGRGTDKASLQQMYLEGREKHGESFVADLMREQLKSVTAELIVIEGNRRMVDLELLNSLSEERGEELKLLYIDASPKIRFTRYNQRQQDEGAPIISWEEFIKLEENPAEDELGLLRNKIKETGCVIDTDNLTKSETCQQAREFLEIS